MKAMISLVLAGGVITWLFISDGVSDIAFTLGGRLEPLYYSNIMGLSNLQIGSLLSILNVTMMVMLPLGGWFADKAGERAGIAIGHVFFSAGYVLMLLGKRYAQFTVVWVMYGIGASLMSPAYNSLISKAVPEKMRGTAYGLFSTSLGLISLPAPYIGGLMWRTLGPRAPFVVPLLSSLILAPLLWIKLGRVNGKSNTAAPEAVDAATPEADIGSTTDRYLAQLEGGPASADV
jgi:MFS family permease